VEYLFLDFHLRIHGGESIEGGFMAGLGDFESSQSMFFPPLFSSHFDGGK